MSESLIFSLPTVVITKIIFRLIDEESVLSFLLTCKKAFSLLKRYKENNYNKTYFSHRTKPHFSKEEWLFARTGRFLLLSNHHKKLFSIACLSGSLILVKQFLNKRRLVITLKALKSACLSKNLKLVKFLYNHSNCCCISINDLLTFACGINNQSLVSYFLTKTTPGYMDLKNALIVGNLEIVGALIRKKVIIETNHIKILLNAQHKNKEKILELIGKEKIKKTLTRVFDYSDWKSEELLFPYLD